MGVDEGKVSSNERQTSSISESRAQSGSLSGSPSAQYGYQNQSGYSPSATTPSSTTASSGYGYGHQTGYSSYNSGSGVGGYASTGYNSTTPSAKVETQTPNTSQKTPQKFHFSPSVSSPAAAHQQSSQSNHTPYQTPSSVSTSDITSPSHHVRPAVVSHLSANAHTATPLAVGTPASQSQFFSSPVLQSPYGSGASRDGTNITPYSTASSAGLHSPTPTPQMRHRTPVHRGSVQSPDVIRPYEPDSANSKYQKPSQTTRHNKVVRRLDVFPKLERDMVVTSDQGGILTIVSYVLLAILILSEVVVWVGQNATPREHVVVETALGKKMRINMNITFPALACEDLHVDVMDVAGDSQLDIEDTFTKTSLHMDGTPLGRSEVLAASERAIQRELDRRSAILNGLSPTYCGSCYGAQDPPDQCCNTCDDVKAAYKKKRWDADDLMKISEQCIREGRQTSDIKLMTKGEGCNINGYMLVNRVAGNFHIAMGEGVDRDGSHIHKFQPEDAPNFNASHTIHELSFGPKVNVGKRNRDEQGGLDGVYKVITEDNGTTGLFQYFLKVVPTYYKERRSDVVPTLETHRFFVTERFRPLMTSSDEIDVDSLLKENEAQPELVGASSGAGTGSGTHAHASHHTIQNSVLPGVFFVYDIYPFAVEIVSNKISVTHLLIRLMALVGGVMSVSSLLASLLSMTGSHSKRGNGHGGMQNNSRRF